MKKINKEQSKKLYKKWKQHLSNSRLKEDEIIRRAKTFARKGMIPNES